MSVRLLLDHAALRLDRNRYDSNTVLIRTHRRSDIERIFSGEQIIDRPDRRYRFRAFVSLDRVAWAFGREIIDKLTNAHLPNPSPARRQSYAAIDSVMANLKDQSPWPSRAPVLRGDWKCIAAQPHHEETFLIDELPRWTHSFDFRLGLLPEQMEDKWFVFYERPWLYFHRSWTGYPVARFLMEAPHHEVRINLNGEHNSGDADTMFNLAIGGFAMMGGRDLDSDKDVLTQWHAYGQAIIGEGHPLGVDPKRMVGLKS